jgi:cytochrome c oxidase assembly protein subunit 15
LRRSGYLYMVRPRSRKSVSFAMKEPLSAVAVRRRVVRLWLLAVAALIFVMVLVGGATRLTESGLSIVEWKPVSGTLPPLSDAEWHQEFEKYQATPQYQRVNRGMSLSEFKTIFWWEWTHRLLGRFIGVAFLLPFLWFLARGWIEPGFRTRLWVIFGLGALQGAVGWWMVASGLADRVEVSQYRLATHLVLACLIFVATLWTAQGLSERAVVAVPRRLRATAIALIGLVMAQLYLGALVAGLRAGLIYTTWPLIDGGIVPDSSRLFFNAPLWRNFFENTLLVQFDHRMLAYGIWLAAVLHMIDVVLSRRSGPMVFGPVAFGAAALLGALTLQIGLGVLTLIYQAPLLFALAHQAVALIVLTIAVMHAERLTPSPSASHLRLVTPSPAPAQDRR